MQGWSGSLDKNDCASSARICFEEYFMKKFLAIYLGSASALAKWKTMDDDHPHFMIFPGDSVEVSVEVMECLPMPEM